MYRATRLGFTGGLHTWHASATMSPTTRRSRVPRKSSMEAALRKRSDTRRYLGPLGLVMLTASARATWWPAGG
jgi:hypothetical protein